MFVFEVAGKPQHPQEQSNSTYLEDRKGTIKKLCDKDFAEHLGELSGAIGLKTLVLLCNE